MFHLRISFSRAGSHALIFISRAPVTAWLVNFTRSSVRVVTRRRAAANSRENHAWGFQCSSIYGRKGVEVGGWLMRHGEYFEGLLPAPVSYLLLIACIVVALRIYRSSFHRIYCFRRTSPAPSLAYLRSGVTYSGRSSPFTTTVIERQNSSWSELSKRRAGARAGFEVCVCMPVYTAVPAAVPARLLREHNFGTSTFGRNHDGYELPPESKQNIDQSEKGKKHKNS